MLLNQFQLLNVSNRLNQNIGEMYQITKKSRQQKNYTPF
jgi:hypothetical protein